MGLTVVVKYSLNASIHVYVHENLHEIYLYNVKSGKNFENKKFMICSSPFWDRLRDFVTSFNSRTSLTWVFMANHVEEEMVKDNVATPEVHQRGGLQPFSN